MLDIKSVNTLINDLNNQKMGIRSNVEDEIDRVSSYLYSLTHELIIYECVDCGGEICWSEYDENGGYCNRCNDC